MKEEFKGYLIQGDARNIFRISNASGKGIIPVKLRGMYTGIVPARQAITAYLDGKGDKDGKAGSTS